MTRQHAIRAAMLRAAGGLAAAVTATAFYWPALGSYFASDDWVVLHHYGDVPWWRLDTHFSLRTIWFYRPLQSVQFAALYQWFGLNAAAFNATLLALHLAVLALAFALVTGFSGRRVSAAGVTVLFATSWISADTLLWKANFNTLQWALAALAACAALDRHRRTGRRAWLAACWVACGLAFFTKEHAVCVPLLLGWVWWCGRGWPVSAPAAREAGRLLLVPCGLTAVYVAAHLTLYENVERFYKMDYSFVSPVAAVIQFLFAVNHSLLQVYADPLLLPHWPAAQRTVAALVRWFLILGPLVAAYGWWRRDRLILLGLGWIVLSMVPVGFLESFHASRFYYLPALGAAMVQWRLLERLVAWGQSRVAWRTHALAAAVAIGAYMVAANAVRLQQIIADDVRVSRRIEALVHFLREQRETVEPGAVIVLRNAPQEFFSAGIGAREMTILALGDPSAEGVVEGQPVEPEQEKNLKMRPHHYLINLTSPRWTLQRLSPNHSQTRP